MHCSISGDVPAETVASKKSCLLFENRSENDEIGPNRKRILIIPSTLAPINAVERYTQITVNPLHRTNKPGVLSLHSNIPRVDQVANVKSEWNCIKTFIDLSGTGKATCVKFGPDAKYIAVGSMDRNLRTLGLPAEDGPLEP